MHVLVLKLGQFFTTLIGEGAPPTGTTAAVVQCVCSVWRAYVTARKKAGVPLAVLVEAGYVELLVQACYLDEAPHNEEAFLLLVQVRQSALTPPLGRCRTPFYMGRGVGNWKWCSEKPGLHVYRYCAHSCSRPSRTCARPAPCALHPAPCTLHPAPCALHTAPCTLRPAPCALRPAPCTLRPAPCVQGANDGLEDSQAYSEAVARCGGVQAVVVCTHTNRKVNP